MKILAITPHQKPDYLAACVIEGLKKLGVELYCTDPGNGAVNIIDYWEFAKHYPTADYILAFFSHKQTPPPRFHFIDANDGWGKTAYVDGSEYNYTSRPGQTDEKLHPVFRERARWYFKRECLPEHVEQGIIPLPYGAIDTDFGGYECEKDIDVLCAFPHVTTGLRAEAVRAVRELGHEGYKVITSAVPDYLKYVTRSWITIEAHGGGQCNQRMWQIMANKSAMLAQKYNIVIPNLEAGRHYAEWSNGAELKAQVRGRLGDKDGLWIFIDASFTNLCLHHTSARRAGYILEHLRSDPR